MKTKRERPQINSRGLLIFLSILIAGTILIQLNHQFPRRYEELTYNEFLGKLTNGVMRSGEVIYYGPDRLQEIRGEYVKLDANGRELKDPQKGTTVTVPFRLEVRVTEPLTQQ